MDSPRTARVGIMTPTLAVQQCRKTWGKKLIMKRRTLVLKFSSMLRTLDAASPAEHTFPQLRQTTHRCVSAEPA